MHACQSPAIAASLAERRARAEGSPLPPEPPLTPPATPRRGGE